MRLNNSSQNIVQNVFVNVYLRSIAIGVQPPNTPLYLIRLRTNTARGFKVHAQVVRLSLETLSLLFFFPNSIPVSGVFVLRNVPIRIF